MQEAISLILLCKKPFSVEAVEHSQWHVRSVQRERMCRTSIPDFHFSPTQKVKGDLSCERPPFFPSFEDPVRNRIATSCHPESVQYLRTEARLSCTYPLQHPLQEVSWFYRLALGCPIAWLISFLVHPDFPCGSSDSPLRSSLIAPCFLSPSRGLLLR